MYSLILFGGARIEGPEGPLTGRVTQRRQLALLALLGVRNRPMSRDKLLALLWPDADADRARHSLTDCVYVIRRALGDDAVQTVGEDLVLNGERIMSDVAAFDAALASGDSEAAAELYQGPLLDGLHLSDAPEFEHWLHGERERLARACLDALEAVSVQRERADDWAGAVEWWRRTVVLEPHNSRLALRFSRALVASGDRAGAIRHATAHAALLEAEYGMSPPPEFVAHVASLRRAAQPLPVTDGPPSTAPPASAPGPAGGHAGTRARAEPDPGGAARDAVQRYAARAAWRHNRWVHASLLLALSVTVLAVSRATSRSVERATDLDSSLVVVMPFRGAGLHPEVAYLSEGMGELIAARLIGSNGELRAASPAVVQAVLRTMTTSTAGPAPDTAFLLAHRIGAAWLLSGAVVGTAASLSLTAELIDAASGDVVSRASATGAEADLHDLVDRAIAELLSRSAGEGEHRLADLTSQSLPALRVFLAARSAHRRGDYETALRLYGHALDLDSTFALAGLGASAVGGWVGGSAPTASRGAAVARRYAHRLSERDRVPLSGTDSDPDRAVTGESRLQALENALRRWPDHPVLWYRRGDHYLHHGAALGMAEWADQARASFERAIELDPDYSEPVHHLASLLASVGDTAALRELVHRQLDRVPSGPVADHLRWRARHALGTAPGMVAPLEAMATDATLRWIGIETQDYGFGLADGARAVRLRLQSAGTQAEQFERRLGVLSYALNRGRPGEAVDLLRSLIDVQPDADFHRRLSILTAIYADGDPALAAELATELGSSPAEGQVAELNACILQQWLLWTGQAELVYRPDIMTAQAAHARDTGPWAVARRMCALVRDAMWLAAREPAGRAAAIDRLEGLIRSAPILGLVDDGHSEYVHLALARLHEAAGDPAAALAALRRRTYYNGWQPYLATMLREEGRLASTLGDATAARRAYRHYLAFRDDPEPALKHEVERVRAALAALGSDQPAP
jgi:DNA-binding SARP family transcriptional activator/TolB-like protein